MKKPYEAPAVERIAFQYRDQVVVASSCYDQYINESTTVNDCDNWEHHDKLS